MGDTVGHKAEGEGVGSPPPLLPTAFFSLQRAAKGKFQPKRAIFALAEEGSALAPLRSPGKRHCGDEERVPKERERTQRSGARALGQAGPPRQGMGGLSPPHPPPALTQVSAFEAQKG